MFTTTRSAVTPYADETKPSEARAPQSRVRCRKQGSQPLPNSCTTRKPKAVLGFTRTKNPDDHLKTAPWELLPSPLFLEQGRGSAPAEEPPGHGVSLPLTPPAQGTVGSLLSPGEQPGRARSHFMLLFATCQDTYPRQLHSRSQVFRFVFPFRQRGSRTGRCCRLHVLLEPPTAAECSHLFCTRLFLMALFYVFHGVFGRHRV